MSSLFTNSFIHNAIELFVMVSTVGDKKTEMSPELSDKDARLSKFSVQFLQPTRVIHCNVSVHL